MHFYTKIVGRLSLTHGNNGKTVKSSVSCVQLDGSYMNEEIKYI